MHRIVAIPRTFGVNVIPLVAISCLLLVGYGARCMWQDRRMPPATSYINMLKQDWQYMPGVSQRDGQLHVEATDFKIVKQDGSGGQPNPPLNLYGTHLTEKDAFTVTAQIANNMGDASLQLYDKPPIIEDEFRIEPPSIKLTERGTDLEVRVWNGSYPKDITKPAPVYDRHFALPSAAMPLSIIRNDTSLEVRAGTIMLADTKQGAIFHSGNIWFGLDSSSGGFMLSRLTAEGTGLQTLDTANATPVPAAGGLQALASKIRPGFKVGAAMALGPLVSDSTYRTQALSNFGLVTPENAMKWQFIEPRQGIYTFREADAIVNTALKQGMEVHGHPLVFSEGLPAWVRNLPTSQVKQVMLNHITTLVSHYKGKVASWDVVNEPLADYDNFDPNTHVLRTNEWLKAMGPGYIADAFYAAHAADPGAKLYINDYGLEADGARWTAFLKLMNQLKAEGVPIYGVGFESHIYDAGDKIDSNTLRDHIDQLAALGLKSRISEMDVYDDDGTTVQATQYAGVFSTCLYDTNCVSFTTWGVNDTYDWFIDDDGSLQQGHDLLFNGIGQTSAYKGLVRTLQK